MDKIIFELNELAKQLDEYILDDTHVNHDGFNKLIEVDFTDPKLREALILIYSKNAADVEAVKKYHYTYLNRLINIMKACINKVENTNTEIKNEVEVKMSKRTFSFPKIFIISISLVFVLGSLFYMITLDREAGAMIVDIVKHGFKVFLESKQDIHVE